MSRYLFQKLLSLVPVLLGISLAAFVLGVISPGNPAELALAQGGYEPTPEQIEAMERQMGLDAPYPVQYLRWVGRAFSGDLGTSYHSRRPVAEELTRRLPVTLKLAGFSMLITCVTGIGLGCVAAAYQDRWPDRLVGTYINISLSFPAFWLALLLILLFAETLRWLPTSGNGGLRYLLLPGLVLSSASAAMAARLTRSALLAEFGKQYFTAAQARGIGRWRLVVRNALPNAIVPAVALLGNSLGGMLGGSVVIESIFALPGIGSYALDAITNRDYPALQGYVLLAGCAYVAVTLLVDIVSMLLNPRVRLGGKRL
ncbi:MAG: ABC transporter permease [Clostridia bacterium]|nr:ABC transporter permease [Clostridia bacterium]